MLCPSLLAYAALAMPQSEPDLEAAAVPAAVEFRVTGAIPGGFVGLALGWTEGTPTLPGGARLRLEPISVLPFPPADAAGNTLLSLPVPFDAATAPVCLAQAIAVDPDLPLGAPGSVRPSPLRTVRFARAGDAADVVLLFGQSNAEGHAPLDGLPEALRGPLPRVRIWNAYTSRFEPLEAGANNMLTPNVPFAGPELGIAAAAEHDAAPVWLCKLALPATSLGPLEGAGNEWAPSAGELYPVLLARLDDAFAALRAQGLRPRVRVCAFVHGETDSLFEGLANGYAARLAELASTLRADLTERDAAGEPTPWFCPAVLPRSLGVIGFPWVDPVRAAQAGLADRLPRVVPVPMDGLPMQPDGVHLALDGVLRLGRSFLFAGWR